MNRLPIWAGIFIFLISQAAVSYAREVTPALLERLPTYEEIKAEAEGETDIEREAYTQAVIENLLEATVEMSGRYTRRENWTATDIRVNDFLQEQREKTEPLTGRPFLYKLRLSRERARAILDRYLPEYHAWREANGKAPVPQSVEVPSLSDLEANDREAYLKAGLVALAVFVGIPLLLILFGWRPWQARHIGRTIIIFGGLVVVAAGLLGDPASAIIMLVIVLIVAGIATGRQGKKMWPKMRRARNQHLLQSCTGMDDETFKAASVEERREAILDHFSDSSHPVSYAAEFKKGQAHVGTLDGKFTAGHIKPFVIRRALGAMEEAGHFLIVNALLYNEGKINEYQFDVRGFSLIFQDGMGSTVSHKGYSGFDTINEVQTQKDALRYVATRRYESVAAVAEATLIDMGDIKRRQLPEEEGLRGAIDYLLKATQ